jgi:hypothetical protein
VVDLAHQQGLKLIGSFALGDLLDHDADRHDAPVRTPERIIVLIPVPDDPWELRNLS